MGTLAYLKKLEAEGKAVAPEAERPEERKPSVLDRLKQMEATAKAAWEGQKGKPAESTASWKKPWTWKPEELGTAPPYGTPEWDRYATRWRHIRANRAAVAERRGGIGIVPRQPPPPGYDEFGNRSFTQGVKEELGGIIPALRNAPKTATDTLATQQAARAVGDAMIGKGDIEQSIQRYRAVRQSAGQYQPSGLGGRAVTGLANIGTQMLDYTVNAAPETAAGAGAGAAYGALTGGGVGAGTGLIGAPPGAAAGALIGASIGAAIGFKVGVSDDIYTVSRGHLYVAMRDAGLSHKPASLGAFITGIPYSLLEGVQFAFMLPGGAGGAAAKKLAGVLQGQSGVLLQGVTRYLTTLGAETAQEVLQDGIEKVGVHATKWAAGLKVPGAVEFMTDLAKSTLTSLKDNASAFLLTSLVPAVGDARRFARLQNASEKAFADHLGVKVEELAERYPQYATHKQRADAIRQARADVADAKQQVWAARELFGQMARKLKEEGRRLAAEADAEQRARVDALRRRGPEADLARVKAMLGREAPSAQTEAALAAPEAAQRPEAPQAPEARTAETEAAVPPSERAEQAMPPSPPPTPQEVAEVADGNEKVVGFINNRRVDKRFTELGMEPPPRAESQAWQERLDRAKADLGANPMAGQDLVKTLRDNMRPHTADEAAMLLMEEARLNMLVDKRLTELEQAEASGNEDATKDARAKLSQAEADYEEAGRVSTLSGSGVGAALNLRKAVLAKDYSLANLRRRARAAKGGEALTPKEEAKLEKVATGIAQRQQAVAAHAEAGHTRASVGAHRDLLNERSDRQQKPAQSPGEIADGLRSGQRTSLNAAAREMARFYIEQGITDREEVIGRVHADLKGVLPEITRREAMDAISGYGVYTQLAQDLVSVQLRDLQGQMQQLAKLADMAEGQAPLKTGGERRAPSDEERRLIALVNEAKRRGGYEVTDPAKQLASALQGIKTRLRNQITDLEKQIATREKIVKERTKVEYDEEADALRAERDALLKTYREIFPPERKPLTQAQRIALAEKGMQRQIDALVARLEAGELFLSKRPAEELQSETLAALRETRDTLRSQLEWLQRIKRPEMRTVDERQIDTYRAQLAKRIADLQARLARQDYSRPGRSVRVLDPKTQALKDEYDALRATFDELSPRAPLTDAQKVERAKGAIERNIKRLIERLEKGEIFPPARRAKPVSTPELDALRAREQDLRNHIEWLQRIKRPEMRTPAQKALDAYKAQLGRRYADYMERIANQDFETKPKKERVLDKEGERLQARVDLAKREFETLRAQWRWNQRTKLGKLSSYLGDSWDLARTLMTSMDLSALLRQGGILALSHPLMAAKTFWQTLPALKSDEAMMQIHNRMVADPDYARFVRMGMEITGIQGPITAQEEAVMSRLAHFIPGVSHSQRIYTMYLNRLRFDAMKTMEASLTRGGEMTAEQGKAIAHYINIATGRGVGPRGDTAMLLNRVFFAPRLVTSRFQYVAAPWQILRAKGARWQIAKEYGRFLAGVAVVYAVAQLGRFGDDDDGKIEFDPRSSMFGKIRFGNTYIDPLSGLAQGIVLGARMLTRQKKTLAGKVVSLKAEEAGYAGDGIPDILWRFMRMKFSPMIAVPIDYWSGENVIGQKVTAKSALAGMVIPMSVRDIYEAMRSEGVPKGAALGTLSMLGVSVQTIIPRKRTRRRRSRRR